jgi:hypothetical protein
MLNISVFSRFDHVTDFKNLGYTLRNFRNIKAEK